MTFIRPTVAQIDLHALRHNVRLVRQKSPTSLVCAVVKADAYGHGLVPCAKAFVEGGADWLGVALVEEGLALRASGIESPILVLAGALGGQDCDALVQARLTPAVSSVGQLHALIDAQRRSTLGPLSIHLEIDTGMSRLGIAPSHLGNVVRAVEHTQGAIELQGVMTHLAKADEPSDPFTARQLGMFHDCLRELRRGGLQPSIVHAANSAGVIAFSEAHHTMVRPGLMLYGLDPMCRLDTEDLLPALSWHTKLIMTREVAPDTPVSYGGRWRAPADRAVTIGTLPVGYGDGYRRSLSGIGEVIIRGRRAPLVGTVCMDLCMVDLTDVSGASSGDDVVLLGRQGESEISAQEMARLLGTIPYEIVCGIAPRVPRLYVDRACEPNRNFVGPS